MERYGPNGAADPTFGNGGRVTASLNGIAVALGVGLDPGTGDVVAVGTSDGRAAVARFTPDGVPDPSFGIGTGNSTGGGYSVFDLAADVAAGIGGSGPSGDSLFSKVIVDSDGSLLAAGATATSGAAGAGGSGAAGVVVVARINTAGGLATTFNPGGPTRGLVVVPGLATRDLSAGGGANAAGDATAGLAIQTLNGQTRILVANRTADGHFGVVRLDPAGAVDAAFGIAGLVTANFGGDDDADFVGVNAATTAGAAAGDIFVAGTTTAAPTTGGVPADAVARVAFAAFHPDGTPDTSFADNGLEVFDSGVPASAPVTRPGAARPDAVNIGAIVEAVFGSLQPDGRVVVGAGRRNSGFGGGSPMGSMRRITPTPLPTPPPTPGPTPTPTPTASLPSGTLGATVAASLPASAVAGSRLSAFTTVTVSNPTQQTIGGRVTVTVYVSPTRSLGGAAEVTAVSQAIKLKTGKTKAIKVKLRSLPGGLADGTYYLIAAVRAPDGSTTGGAGPTLVIAAPSVAVKASNVRPLAASARPGKPAALSLALTNTGTAPAAGTASLTVSPSDPSSGAAGPSAAPVPLRVKLAAKASKTYRVKFAIPSGLGAGRYLLSVSLDVATLGDPTAADGVAVSTATLLIK